MTNRRAFAECLVAFLIVGLLFAVVTIAWARGGLTGGGARAPFTPTVYYVTGFNNPTWGPLQLEQSYDGINWNMATINYGPTCVRDPNIFVNHSSVPVKVSGLYWLSYTAVTTCFQDASQSYGLASSPDLINWTFVQMLDCSTVTGTGANARCWGPTMYQDDAGGMHTITGMCGNCPNEDHFQLYEMHPQAQANPAGQWSLPTLIQFSPAFDNVLPGWIYRDNTTTRRFFVNHLGNPAARCTEEWVSTSDFTGYTALHTGAWNNWGCQKEVNNQALHIGNLFYFSLFDNNANFDVVSTTTDPTGTTFTTPVNANFGNFNAIGFFQVPGGTQPTPPTPVSISFSPSSPQIADNSLSGAQVATITVGMSDGSLFNGTLSFAPPTACTLSTCFGNSSGMFAVATGATNQLTLGRNLVAGDDGAHSATIAATQNGTTFEASITTTVLSAAPGPAVAAGFTTLAADLTFSQPQYATQSNWLDCTQSDSTKLLHYGSQNDPVSGLPPCNINQVTDPVTGDKVINMQWLHTYTGGCGSTGCLMMSTSLDGTHYFAFPNYYAETVARIDNRSSNGSSYSVAASWQGQYYGSTWIGADIEQDWLELVNFSSGGGDSAVHNHLTGTPNNFIWSGSPSNVTGWDVTTYHKYGFLSTSDGSTHSYGCSFVDDVLQGCIDMGATGQQYLQRNYLLWTNGSNGTSPPDTAYYIKYTRVYSCANWALPAGQIPTAANMCNGSTLFQGTQNGQTLIYWH